ncbi:MAG: AbrB/MazE/SpoVT family DNA-binding domain-containing protein [Defluviicoccus sp.]|nr:AbrB/MazE/SpoVT family DNA-binding domain-containing protein [Defluviicoccus sp.]MDE0386789.1 AbrB/MazE/SpoVT family DNA-binding domain-containing protein [Defluviicoccus sp.]
MPLVTVKPKFQVTIPAKLRRNIDLREGDIMEATLVGDGILFRPKEVVDRDAAADRIAAKFGATRTSPEDLGRSEDEIVRDSIAEISASRRERRLRET